MVVMWLMSMALAGPLAIVPFQDASGDPELTPLGMGLAGMLISDLCGGPDLVCVERAKLGALMEEIALAKTGFLDPETAQRLGRGVGAEWVLLGTLTAAGGDIRLDARLVDVESSMVLETVSRKGPRASFFDLEQRLAADLSNRLGVRPTTGATMSSDSIRLYGQALLALDAGSEGLARTLLDAAVREDGAMRYAADRLEALDVALGRAREARDDALPAELVALVDGAVTGSTGACSALQAKFSTMLPPITMGGRLLTLEPSFALGRWSEAGLSRPPATIAELARGVGRQLHDAHGVASLVLDRSAPDDLCPGANPNEVVLAGMIVALGAARESAGMAVEMGMVAPDGSATSPDRLDDWLLQYADDYVRRFPTGALVPTLAVWVGPAATRVARRP